MRSTGFLVLFAVLTTISACEARNDAGTVVEYFQSPATEGMDLPFPDAVRVDNLLFLSGTIGNVPGTFELAEGGIEGETRQTMDNIQSTLEAVGLTMDDIVKCTVFLADVGDWSAMNAVYHTYFETPPARSALGANGLAIGALVEIECIAVFRD